MEDFRRVQNSDNSIDEQQTTHLNSDIDDTYLRIGGFGRFQVLALIFISLGMISVSAWMYALGFFLQVPNYLCTLGDGSVISCKHDKICDEDNQVSSWEVDWSSDRSFHNWFVKFGLTCKPVWQRAMPSSLYFFGWFLTSFWLPALSDIYGRKKFFLFG